MQFVDLVAMRTNKSLHVGKNKAKILQENKFGDIFWHQTRFERRYPSMYGLCRKIDGWMYVCMLPFFLIEGV